MSERKRVSDLLTYSDLLAYMVERLRAPDECPRCGGALLDHRSDRLECRVYNPDTGQYGCGFVLVAHTIWLPDEDSP